MINRIRQLTFAFISALAMFTVAAAQAKGPDYAETKEFKSKIYELKYRDPQELYATIRVLGSGFKGADVSINSSNKTIAVRDFLENLLTITEAIKRLDVPSTKSEPTVELTMHVFLTNTGQSSDQLPTDLKDVLKQLQTTLAFKDYQLVTSIAQRGRARGRTNNNALFGKGNAIWKELSEDGQKTVSGLADYEYRVNSMDVVTGSSGVSSVQLSSYYLSFGKSSVQSDLELRDGEKVVVGTTGFGNKAMFLVLSAKVVK